MTDDNSPTIDAHRMFWKMTTAHQTLRETSRAGRIADYDLCSKFDPRVWRVG